jgi:CheY-like chemotaxis protein
MVAKKREPRSQRKPARIRVVHWNAEEAQERALCLAGLGFVVEAAVPEGPAFLKEIAASLPETIVVDLTRLPSHGRDMALAIRQKKATRRIPLVFAGGEPSKVEGVRKLLPDAVFTPWDNVEAAIREAIAHPPDDPVVPKSRLEAYSKTPLMRKLGVKQDSHVGVIGGRAILAGLLGPLPGSAKLEEGIGKACHLALWFVRSNKELESEIGSWARRLPPVPLWICWPKKASGAGSNVTEQVVRAAGLSRGLVDYKVCSLDATWSGLLFRKRKSKPG